MNVNSGSATEVNGEYRHGTIDIIEAGKNFLPDVDFDRFSKYSYLFDESNFITIPDAHKSIVSRNPYKHYGSKTL